MNIIDEHYKRLPLKKKKFLAFTIAGFFVVAMLGKIISALTGFESLLLFIVGILFMSIMKLEYRIEDLEKKKK